MRSSSIGRVAPSTASVLAVLVLLALGPAALGNSRALAVTGVQADLGRPPGQPRLLVAATFGVLVSDDGGQTWQLICEDPIGLANAPLDPIVRSSSAGLFLVASQNGMLYSRDGGCTFTQSGGSMAGQSVTDVAISPMQVLATTNTAAVPNGVHRSQDGGATFSGPLPASPTAIFRGVQFAGSDGRRVYALGYDTTGMQTVTALYRSDDGGATFRGNPYTVTDLTSPDLIGADPRDPNRVYSRAAPTAPLSFTARPTAG